MRFIRGFLIIAFFSFSALAWAHDPGLSSARFALYPDGIELVITFSAVDARWLMAEEADHSFPGPNEEFTRAALIRRATTLWHLSAASSELSPLSTSVEFAPGGNVVYTQRYALPRIDALRFDSGIFDLLPPGHRQHVTVLESKDHILLAKLLSPAEAGFDVLLPPTGINSERVVQTGDRTVSFGRFFGLGIEHILTGYDHLLFLFAFLITARGIRAVLKIVTSFTAAHSITLALSALNVVSVPSNWVEPLIAATIVFVALQNLLKREHTAERVGLTFAFGLVHGFGFASVLRDMGISSLGTSAWRALAGFNAGVELGQIAVAAVVFPLLWYLRSLKSYERSLAPAASALIALAGAYWLVQRIGWA